jgi:hypothetical protein
MSDIQGEAPRHGVPSAAEERTAKLAEKAGEEAANTANELLVRHIDLIGPTVIDFITGREFERASEAAKVARAEGRMNDNYSQAPGLTAFMTKSGFEGLSEAAKKDGKASYLSGYVAEMQPVDPGETVYSLRLPRGMYGMGFGGCTLYGEASAEGNQLHRDRPFSMPYETVIRVEGDSGEIWQNADLQPDGTPRER